MKNKPVYTSDWFVYDESCNKYKFDDQCVMCRNELEDWFYVPQEDHMIRFKVYLMPLHKAVRVYKSKTRKDIHSSILCRRSTVHNAYVWATSI